jgi:hypothetical protein
VNPLTDFQVLAKAGRHSVIPGDHLIRHSGEVRIVKTAYRRCAAIDGNRALAARIRPPVDRPSSRSANRSPGCVETSNGGRRVLRLKKMTAWFPPRHVTE